ncbi:MAG: sporulation protein YunB [Bacillota bacterium]
MRRFRRFRPVLWTRWLRWPVLAGAVLYLLLRLADLLLLGPLGAVAEVEARRIGIEAVNRVVTEQVGRNLRHENLVHYEKDQTGRIAAYRVNTPVVNQVAAQAARAVQEELRRLAQAPFGVPVGALTGSTLLGTSGPRLPVKLLPIGTVAIDVKQEFKGEGINQTRHRVWLQATALMQVVLPLTTREVQVTQELPLSETVIVGPVPDSFYGGPLGGVSLPLKP